MKKILAASLFALALPAVAGDLYVVGSVGQSKVDINKNELDTLLLDEGITGLSSRTDETDTAYKLQLGYQFNKNFAVEGGYVDLGKAGYSANFTGGSASADFKATGWNLSAVGILPINDAFSVFGKVGTIRAEVKTSVSANAGAAAASGSAKSSDWKGTWGVGANYQFTKQIGVRVEYERFHDLGDDNTGKGDVDLVSAGVSYKF